MDLRRLFVRDSSRRRQHTDLGLRKLIEPIARPYRARLVTISVVSVLGGFVEAGMLLVIARAALALASGDDTVAVTVPVIGNVDTTVDALLVGAAVLVFVRIALLWASTALSAHVSADVLLATRRSMTHLLLNASWPLQATQRAGRAQELIGGFAGSAAGAVSALSGLVIAAFSLGAMLIAAVVVSPLAAVGAAAAALLIGMLLRPLRAAVRRRSARGADANLALGTGLTELTSALQETRIFGVERQIEARIDELASDSRRLGLKTAYITGAIPIIYQGAAMLLIVGALAIALGAGVTGTGSIGAVVLIMLRSFSYAQAVQGSIQGLHAAAPQLEVLRDEEDRYRAAAVPEGGAPLDRVGTVEFERVGFEYEPGRPVLRDVSFSIPRGEIVGVVGPSGAGKSTLVQLLLRLRDPTVGQMLVDGSDVREISSLAWYDRVTFVPQDARLFAGTIADNIRFFRDDIEPGTIERAAKLAHIHDDIVSWPDGYDTPVGERGNQLSGGQQQRLCIARALVGDPDLVVLDEPTSSLDVRSEALMRETIADLAPAKTVIVIAHRLSTLSICDRIMVILNGRVEGFDDPATLEATNPFYREALQLSGMR